MNRIPNNHEAKLRASKGAQNPSVGHQCPSMPPPGCVTVAVNHFDFEEKLNGSNTTGPKALNVASLLDQKEGSVVAMVKDVP